jgi:hypothetical protein
MVVEAGAFDPPTVALGGAVIERDDQTIARLDDFQDDAEQRHGHRADTAAETAEEVIMRAEVVADGDGT